MNKQSIVVVFIIVISNVLALPAYGQLFAPKQVINPDGGNVRAIALGDFDGDNDLDIVSGGDIYAAWYENEDGEGTFIQQTVFDDQLSQAFNLTTGDLDNDNDIDIIN